MVYKLKCEYLIISSGWGLAFFFLDRDNLSTSLQAENLCATKAKKIAKNTVNTLRKMRIDEKINLI